MLHVVISMETKPWKMLYNFKPSWLCPRSYTVGAYSVPGKQVAGISKEADCFRMGLYAPYVGSKVIYGIWKIIACVE